MYDNDFEKIKEEIIYKDANLRAFFEAVDKKRCGRKWYINKSSLRADYLGQTMIEDKYINIYLKTDEIRKSLKSGQEYHEKEKAILIHELGEADYMLSRLPILSSTEHNNICSDFQEVLSHKYIEYVLKNYGNLYNFVYSNLVCTKSYNEKEDSLEKIIGTCHLLTTYPNLKKNEIVYKYKETENELEAIDSIMHIINDIFTLNQEVNDINIINENTKKIIEILKDNGMKYEIEINNL